MISDALQRAVEEIERCLRDLPECYAQPADLRARLLELCERMDNMRNEIDCGPAHMQEDMVRAARKSV